MLRDQNIVIFGATGTLGSHFLAHAQSLGARCISVGRRSSGAQVPHFQCDITSLAEVQKVAHEIGEQARRVDVLLNFTGVHHSPMDFGKDDPTKLAEDYDRVMAVNLTGAFYLTAVFARMMVAQRHGHIIHLCSDGSRQSLYGSYAYNISKHGLEGLIKTAATQLAPFGVRVNGVAPGTVETALNRHLLRSGDGTTYSPRALSILAHTPTKKFATLEGVSETIAAMCLPQRHLTGNVVFCDDGYHVEGHSWPLGNEALFKGEQDLQKLFEGLTEEYPVAPAT